MIDRFNIPEENEQGHIHIVNLLAGQVLGLLGSASDEYKVVKQDMIDTSKFVEMVTCQSLDFFLKTTTRSCVLCSYNIFRPITIMEISE